MFVATLAYLGITCLYFLVQPYTWLLGALVPLLILYIDSQDDKNEPGFVATLLFRLSIIGTLPVIALLVNWVISGQITSKYYFPTTGTWILGKYLAAMAISMVAVFVVLRTGSQLLDRAKSKMTKKTSLERNHKTDVRDIHKLLPAEIGKYDPEKYFPNPLKSSSLFVGLDEYRQPVYIDYETWKIQHGLLTGRSRSGKGVAAQILLSQAIARGEYVVVLDPKTDDYMPHIFKAQCEKHGYAYRFINLNQEAPPQTNIFEDCTESEVENMLIGAFGLSEKGDIADHYRLKDRRAARQAARWFKENPGKTARDCLVALGEQWEDMEGFREFMSEVSELPSVNRPSGTGGINIVEGEQTGGMLYVVGDMINTRVLRMQRMVLLRLLFLVKNRDQIKKGRTICVLADEFRVHISPAFMTSLGASAGWGLHTILAMQSVSDLASVPKDLDKEAVKGSVFENTSLKISYAIEDPDTAELVARTSGKIQVDDESRRVRKNAALAETVDGERTIRQAERYYFDDTIISNMPKGCAMLKIPGQLARFCFTSPVDAGERTPVATTPTAPLMPATAAAAGVSVGEEALSLDDDDFPDPMAPPEYSEEPEPQELATPDPAPAPRTPMCPATATPSPACSNPLDLDGF